MGRVGQICSLYSVMIRDFNHDAFVAFRRSADGISSVKRNPKNWLLLKKRHSVCRGLLQPNRIRRLGETSGLSTERHPPSRCPSIRARHRTFMETGTVLENMDLDVLRATHASIKRCIK